MLKKYLLFENVKTDDIAFRLDMQVLDIEVPMHTHDCTELVIILDGRAIHVIDGEEYSLKTGDVFVVNLNSVHSYKSVDNLKLCNIMFNYSSLVENTNELKLIPGFQSLFILEPYFRKEHKFESKLELNLVDLNFTGDLLELLKTEYINRLSGYKPIIQTYFLTLITFLSRRFSVELNKPSNKLFQIASAIVYIENNYLSKITLDKIAKMAFLSVRQFTRIFCNAYNKSPKKYIIQLRMEHARKLVRDSNIKISTIATECGFSDISFFSKQFKSYFGITPLKYREI